jgi:DNA primase
VSLTPQWLDELRARTTLSALIRQDVKLISKAGEHKACCPFHHEKTPSFTVSDDKGFYHCFGCAAHGDAIRWMIDHRGLEFIDAVKELAAAAGMEMPARSLEASKRDENLNTAADVLAKAAAWYAEQLTPEIREALAGRGVSAEAIAKFGIGFAPARKSVIGCGAPQDALVAAGVLIAEDSGLYRDRFRNRLMIPIHDARGRIVGFAGRIHGDGEPKYLNSPESDHFAKGRLLFNLHRATPAARAARRLIIVEGQFDTIALDQVGISETVAPQGTALTEHQLERAWRAAHCPVLLFDGDSAGQKAAMRAAERAMPHVGPGKSLAIAALPEGEDPDNVARDRGRDGVEALIAAARPLSGWLWETLHAQAVAPVSGPSTPTGAGCTPEARSALWARLAALAAQIRDPETKAQYLAEWRRSFDQAFPPPPPGLTQEDMLPDGSVAGLSELEEGAQARLRSVVAAWLERTTADPVWDVARAGRWAWELGRRVTAGLVEEEAAEDALAAVEKRLTFRTHPPPDLKDYRRSFDIGRKRGFNLGPLLTDMKCAAFERTDMGNAERWHARFGQDYLYTTAKGWLGWDGRRYRVLNQEKDAIPAEVLASVFKTVRAIQDEAHFVRATGVPEDEEIEEKALALMGIDPRRAGGMDRFILGGKKPEPLSKKLSAWGRASEASGRIGCIANLAKRWVTVELTEFDTDPMLLNCMNGTLRFIRGGESGDDGPPRVELQPHRREDRLTKVTACDYDADAPAPLFQKTVKWAQPEVARRRYLRQWLGYNLTGDMGEQIFHIWYGPLAANGKSTVGNACREATGDYGDTTNVETFLDEGPRKHGDQATPAIVRLPGVRFLTAGEPPKGAKINEPLINSVTGGDPMLARDNFRSFFRFMPIFKFTMWCNDLPSIPQGTAGIWRRVKVMPWEQHLALHERDLELPKKLQAEYAGILAWMVRGAIDWMEHGFVEPESVQLASADYKHDSDPLSSFLKLCTEPDPHGRVQSSHLYETFCAWAKAAGETEWKQKGFSQALKAKGLASKASNGMHWIGLTMTKRAADFVDHEGKVVKLDAIGDVGGDGPGSDAPPHPPASDDDDDIPWP